MSGTVCPGFEHFGGNRCRSGRNGIAIGNVFGYVLGGMAIANDGRASVPGEKVLSDLSNVPWYENPVRHDASLDFTRGNYQKTQA